MSAEVIPFPGRLSRHGLSDQEVADISRYVELTPGVWVIRPGFEGDLSRLWLCLRNSDVAGGPVFGFSRKRGLIQVIVRHLDPNFLGDDGEIPFPSIVAALATVIDAVHAAVGDNRAPDPAAA